MAVVTDVMLGIAGKAPESVYALSCSYTLAFDAAEIANKISFTVCGELWGRDWLLDTRLAEFVCDGHAVAEVESFFKALSFELTALALKRSGASALYLKINAYSPLGLTFSASSPVVSVRRDWHRGAIDGAVPA